MNTKIKAIVGTIGAAVFLNFTAPGQAIAVWCQADAPMVYQNMVTQFMPFLKGIIGDTGQQTEQAVIEAGASTRAEILKGTMADKAVLEGLESYRQQEDARQRAVDLGESLKQPATTCQAMATSANIGTAQQNAQAQAFRSQAELMSRIGPTGNVVASMESNYRKSSDSYCTPEEAAQGICRTRSDGLAGADQDAMFLFQDGDGSSSFAGNGAAQAAAADGYIDRIVNGVPLQGLPQQGEKFYRQSAQARAFVELARRYNAMQSMGAYSLKQIKEMHKTQANLGADTMLATVPGFASKNDMSMSEAVERFVATKFSPDSVADLSKATKSNLILRDMAQMSSFQLWMSYQAMLQSSRVEGLQAHQLALLTEQTLRPQLEAQRQAAMRARVASK